jgi:hypothetical protein
MVLVRVSALALFVSLCSPHSQCTSSYVHYTHRTSSLCLPARPTGTVNTRGECLLPWPEALWRLRHARGQRWRLVARCGSAAGALVNWRLGASPLYGSCWPSGGLVLPWARLPGFLLPQSLEVVLRRTIALWPAVFEPGASAGSSASGPLDDPVEFRLVS